MVRLNAAFHATILGIHPNIEALRLLGYHLAIMNAIRLRFGYAAARLRQIVRDHRALIKCCDLRDAAAAENSDAIAHSELAALPKRRRKRGFPQHLKSPRDGDGGRGARHVKETTNSS